MLLDGNSNYFGAISPTGRNIQGIVPNKRYFVLRNILQPESKGQTFLKVPIPYRTTLRGGIQQDVTLLIREDLNGNTNIFLKNLTPEKVQYSCAVSQLLDSSPSGLYRQVNTETQTLDGNHESTSPLITLSKIGGDKGNDTGQLNLSLLINGLTISAIIEWHTPLATLNADGWLSLETIDRFTDSI